MLVNAAAGMAVPLVTGVWSDRLQRRGRGRRMPFIVGGTVVTAGGLLAIAFGFNTSYLVLALFAAVVYTGLNALTTAHRALVPETFDEAGRARATSAQELALLAGGPRPRGRGSLRGSAVGAVRAGGDPRPVARDADDRPRPRARGGRRGRASLAPMEPRITCTLSGVRASARSSWLRSSTRLRGSAGVLPPVRRGRPFARAGRRVAVASGLRARHRRRDPGRRPDSPARPAPPAPRPRRRPPRGGFLGVAAATSLPVVAAPSSSARSGSGSSRRSASRSSPR